MSFNRLCFPQIGIGLGVAVLLVFLFVNARYTDPARHNRIVANLGEIEQLSSDLNEVVLEIRYGLLGNIEPLVAALDGIKRRKRELEAGEYAIVRQGDDEIDREMAAFSQALLQQQEMIERFKSHNAILKNSFYYMPLEVVEATASGLPKDLHGVLQSLLHEVLLLHVTSSREGYQRVTQGLAQLQAALTRYTGPARSKLESVAQHVRNILAHQREMDDLISQITAGDVKQLGRKVSASYNRSFERRLRGADVYRYFLFLASLGLLAYSAYSYRRQHDGAGRLRQALSAVENQKLALDRHAEQLRVVASALENTAEGVMITNADRRIVSVNKSFTDITGYTAEEAVGRSAIFLRPGGEGDAEFYAQVWDAVQKSGRWQGEVSRRRKNGEIFPQFHSISAVKDPSGKTTHYVTVFSDISLNRENEARLEFLAHHDVLTQLPNRALFHDRFQEALHRAHRHGNPVGLMFVDLDHFKIINDSLGHAIGDLLLQTAARRLEECVRETDTIARFGGDEFTILLDELKATRDTVTVAEKLLEVLALPYWLAERELFITASIGITCYPDDGDDMQVLLNNADAAMYRAKQQGRNNYQFFSAEMKDHALENLALTNDLRKALERSELLLHYQPRVALSSGKITGVEALIRWQHPQLGLLGPARFVPLAEETGMIRPIGEWVIEAACRQMQAWQASGLAPPRIAVNLSARQFRQADLPQRIVSILAETGLDARQLEVEITESMVMHDPDRAQKMLAELHALGIAVSVDDFGTGYSSLSFLKRFPLDYLKIDESFVRDLPHDADDVAITRAIIALAGSLKLRVIAEGVETAEQRDFLHSEGCEEMQGHLFSRPCTAADQEALLRENAAGNGTAGDLFQPRSPHAG